MKYSETVAEVDTGIMQACARFVNQVRPLLAMDSLAVVLLEPEGDTSRVVFSWGAVHQSETPRGHSVTPQPPTAAVDQPSLCITLDGREGPIGAVLFRGSFPLAYGPEQQGHVQHCAQQLALMLENIHLQHCLERKTAEARAFERIAEIVSSNAPVSRIYRRFAGEVK